METLNEDEAGARKNADPKPAELPMHGAAPALIESQKAAAGKARLTVWTRHIADEPLEGVQLCSCFLASGERFFPEREAVYEDVRPNGLFVLTTSMPRSRFIAPCYHGGGIDCRRNGLPLH
jgi:hypothetical protein